MCRRLPPPLRGKQLPSQLPPLQMRDARMLVQIQRPLQYRLMGSHNRVNCIRLPFGKRHSLDPTINP